MSNNKINKSKHAGSKYSAEKEIKVGADSADISKTPSTPLTKTRTFNLYLIFCISIFAVAAVVRAVFLSQIVDIPFFNNPIIDPKQYDDFARLIVKGNLYPFQSLTQAPFYSYFLAAIYTIFGDDRAIAHVVHALLGAFNVILIFILSKRIFSPSAAVISSVITAFYGTLIFYEGDFYRENLLITLFLLLAISIYWAIKNPKPQDKRYKIPFYSFPLKWLTAGFFLALSVITRENSIFLLPLLIYVIWFIAKARTGVKVISTIMVFIPLLFSMYQMAKYNHEAEGKWSAFSKGGGMAFYMGNTSDMDRATTLQPGIEYEKITTLALHEAGIINSSDASDWYYRKTFNIILSNPFQWSGLMLKKLYLFWASYEMMPNEDVKLYRDSSSILRSLMWRWGWFSFPFGIISPLALLGFVFIARNRRKEELIILLFVLLYMTSIVIFHVRTRYRLPVTPLVIVIASYAITRLFSFLKNSDKKMFFRFSGLLALFFFLLNFPFFNFSYAERFPTNYFVGKIYNDLNEFGKAEHNFKQAINDGICLPEVYNDLAILYTTQGRNKLAIFALQKSISLSPDFDKMRVTLGKTYRNVGLLEIARKEYENALSINRYNPETFVELGEVSEENEPDYAKDSYHKVLELGKFLPFVDPDLLKRARNGLWRLGEVDIDDSNIMSQKSKAANFNIVTKQSFDIIERSDLSTKEGRITASDAWNNIGVSYLRLNNLEEAKKCFMNSLKISYHQTPAHINIAIVYRKMELFDDAIKHYKEVLKIIPDNYLALNNLGTIYRDKKDYRKALKYLNMALDLAPDNATIRKNIKVVEMRMDGQTP